MSTRKSCEDSIDSTLTTMARYFLKGYENNASGKEVSLRGWRASSLAREADYLNGFASFRGRSRTQARRNASCSDGCGLSSGIGRLANFHRSPLQLRRSCRGD